MCSYDELDTLLNENWIANSSARQLTFDREEIKPILKEYRLKQIYEKIFPELKQLQESLYLKPENFLTFLISRTMDAIPSSSEDAKKQLRMLALICTYPKFLFGKITKLNKRELTKPLPPHNPDHLLSTLGNFDICWKEFEHEHELCLHYIKRGTTDLDRPPVRSPAGVNSSSRTEKLTPQEKADLISDINDLYRSYYYSLTSLGYRPSKIPVVNPKDNSSGNCDEEEYQDSLIENCYEKDWLLPIAHVILIRDAQYQMMGKGKYKKSELLQQGSREFKLDYSNKDIPITMAAAASITYAASLAARNILEYYLGKHFSCNPVGLAMDKLISNHPPHIHNSFPGIAEIDYLQNLRREKRNQALKRKNKKQADLLFPVPDCDPYIMAIQIGNALNLQTSQIEKLKEKLPDLLWERKNVKAELAELTAGGMTESTGELLVELVESIKKFLSPKRYYSRDTISDPLIRSSEVFDENKIQKRLEQKSSFKTKAQKRQKTISELLKGTRKAFSPFIVFRDLTPHMLMISHAIEPSEGILIPDILEHYLSKLKKKLKKYYRKQVRLKLFGLSKDYIDSKKLCRYDERFQDAKEEISKNLKWIDAKDFLEKCVIKISQEDDPRQKNKFICEYIDTHLSTQLSKWDLSSLRAEKINLIYFRFFSYLLKASLQLLRIEMLNKMTSLLEKSLQTEKVGNSEG